MKYMVVSHPEPAQKSLERRVNERRINERVAALQQQDATTAVVQYQKIVSQRCGDGAAEAVIDILIPQSPGDKDWTWGLSGAFSRFATDPGIMRFLPFLWVLLGLLTQRCEKAQKGP